MNKRKNPGIRHIDSGKPASIIISRSSIDTGFFPWTWSLSHSNCIVFSEHDEYHYDSAGTSALEPRNTRIKKLVTNSETINNPYYDGNEVLEMNGLRSNTPDQTNKINTLKIVNNVYYEWIADALCTSSRKKNSVD